MTEHPTPSHGIHSMVREHFPSFTADECELVIWECTCFPFGSLDDVRQNLADLSVKANNFPSAMRVAAGEFDREWAETDEPDYEFTEASK